MTPYGFQEGLAPVKQDGKYSYIDQKGRMVVSPRFDLAFRFSEGLAPVMLNGKWGYINRIGQFVLNPQFDSAGSFSEGLACVSFNGIYGYIDRTGRMVISNQSGEPFLGGLAWTPISSTAGVTGRYFDRLGKTIWDQAEYEVMFASKRLQSSPGYQNSPSNQSNSSSQGQPKYYNVIYICTWCCTGRFNPDGESGEMTTFAQGKDETDAGFNGIDQLEVRQRCKEMARSNGGLNGTPKFKRASLVR
ncbi:MAG: WG repeat-containing protein [Acidobacteriota bacterium]